MKLKICKDIFTIKKLDKESNKELNCDIFCFINEYDGLSVIEKISQNTRHTLKF